jgi:hypothetical protein
MSSWTVRPAVLPVLRSRDESFCTRRVDVVGESENLDLVPVWRAGTAPISSRAIGTVVLRISMWRSRK